MATTAAGPTAGRSTSYKGIRMRSRLEASYAAELDRQHQRWAYEPECFANAHGQWLPDFAHDFGDPSDPRPLAIFSEVKPIGPLQSLIVEHGQDLAEPHIAYVDPLLSRLEIAWDSRPDALLELVFWPFGGPWYLDFCAFSWSRWQFYKRDQAGPTLWAGRQDRQLMSRDAHATPSPP